MIPDSLLNLDIKLLLQNTCNQAEQGDSGIGGGGSSCLYAQTSGHEQHQVRHPIDTASQNPRTESFPLLSLDIQKAW